MKARAEQIKFQAQLFPVRLKETDVNDGESGKKNPKICDRQREINTQINDKKK